jgi:hypothetical protein
MISTNRTLLLVIEAAVERVVEPFIGALPVRFRQCFFGLQRVVDDDDVGTPPGQHAADRGGDPAALCGRLELGYGLSLQPQPRQKAAGTSRWRQRAGNRATICRRALAHS